MDETASAIRGIKSSKRSTEARSVSVATDSGATPTTSAAKKKEAAKVTAANKKRAAAKTRVSRPFLSP